MMNKKSFAIIIALVVLIMAIGYVIYMPYQEEVLNNSFKDNLKNVSAVESEIVASYDKFSKQDSADIDNIINSLDTEIIPKYSDEIYKLNKTMDYTNNDEVKIQYIELQSRRVQLEAKNLNDTVIELNAISTFLKGEKSVVDSQNDIDHANAMLENDTAELKKVFEDIRTLLADNPDFNQTLHELDLEPGFYGESILKPQASNLTNTEIQ